MLLAWILAVATVGTTVHPYVQTVERFRAARKAHDVDTLREVLTDDSRIWFGERKGEGRPRSLDGGGPWSQWDTLFESESTILDTHVEDHALRTTVSEINDWYRLVERPPTKYSITYYFDHAGRIEGTLIHSLDDAPPEPDDRLDEFVAWAQTHDPDLMEVLMPGGEIDPTQASLWKKKLLQWRAEAGLANPLAH
jgi:hypothetical protein